MISRHLAAVFVPLALAACGPNLGPTGDGTRVGLRQSALPELRSIGEPGKVAATDIAFARAAREAGQWSAFRQYAASGAVLHLPEGIVDAGDWLSRRADPAEAVRWGPEEVWTSCDGTVAVTSGRFQEPDGRVGTYATAWELQRDNSFRWTYRLAALDNPQPPPPEPEDEPGEDTIVVSGIGLVQGRVADCGIGSDRLPDFHTIQAPATGGGKQSRDGTLKWRWLHSPGESRLFTVDYFREGAWNEALEIVESLRGA